MCGGRPPHAERITTSAPLACLGHHCAVQNTPAEKRSPERGLISRGHTGSSLAGVQREHYPSTTLPQDNGDNSRILSSVATAHRPWGLLREGKHLVSYAKTHLDVAHTGQTLFDPWPLLCPPGSVRYLSRIRRTCGCPGGGSGEVIQTCRCHLPRIADSPIFVPDRGR